MTSWISRTAVGIALAAGTIMIPAVASAHSAPKATTAATTKVDTGANVQSGPNVQSGLQQTGGSQVDAGGGQ